MGLQPWLDQYFPPPGHGVGLSLGWGSVLWLTHLLSAGDHRLHPVAPWATPRLHTLRTCTGPVVRPLEVGDDRLAPVLEALRDDRRWSALEGARHHHVRRVYDLAPACVRLESTTATGQGTVTEDGWCPCGPSPDHRPDLPQVQVLVSALDRLGRPVATDGGPGQRADEPVSVPAISRVREGVGRRGRL
jgi:transposase